MAKRKLAAVGLTILSALAGLAGVACDQEDVRDAEEGARDVGREVEKGADEAEDAFDDEVDTDGKDD